MRAEGHSWLWVLSFTQLLLTSFGYTGNDDLQQSRAFVAIDPEGDIAGKVLPTEVARRPRAKHRRDIVSKGQTVNRAVLQEQPLTPSSGAQIGAALDQAPAQSAASTGPSSPFSLAEEHRRSASTLEDSIPPSRSVGDPTPTEQPQNPAGSNEASSSSDIEGPQKCRVEYKTTQGLAGEHRISGLNLGEFNGEFHAFRNENCTDKLENVEIQAVHFPNKENLTGSSSITLRFVRWYRWEPLFYVCSGTVESQEVQSCFAKIDSSPEGNRVATVATALGEHDLMPLLESTNEILCIAFGLACLHSIFLLITLQQHSAVHALEGVAQTSIAVLWVNTLVKGLMFLGGIDGMLVAIVKLCLSDCPRWMINAVFLSSGLLSFTGTIRFATLLYSSQLYEIGLRQGKCVLPGATSWTRKIFGQWISLSILDVLLVVSLGVFAACCLLGMVFAAGLSIDNLIKELFWGGPRQEEFRLCRQPFPSLLSAVASVMLTHTLQAKGLCQASLRDLSSQTEEGKLKGSEPTLLEHLAKHRQASLTMNQFCEACRTGRDPLSLVDMEGQDPDSLPSGSGLGMLDLRWHARYVHRKTGSIVTIFTLPLCLLLLAEGSDRLLGNWVKYTRAEPHLAYAVPSQGTLFPRFSRNAKDYTLYYPEYVSSISLLNHGDDLLSRRKEFTFMERTQNESVGIGENLMYQIAVPQIRDGSNGALRLNASLFGGNGTGNQETKYNIALSKLTSVIATATFTAGSWSRCSYTLPIHEYHLTVPENTSIVTMEVSVVLHTQGIPISLKKWHKLDSSANPSLLTNPTSVFEELKSPTYAQCNVRCLSLSFGNFSSICSMSSQLPTGCLYVMLKKTENSCEALAKKGSRRLVFTGSVGRTLEALANDTLNEMSVEQSTDVHAATLIGRFYEPPVTHRLNDGIRTQWRVRFASRSKSQSVATELFSKTIDLWKKAPGPNTLFVVPQRGLEIQPLTGADGNFNVVVKKWKVSNIIEPLRFLVFAVVMDNYFEIEFDTDSAVSEWDGSQTDFDLAGYCKKVDESVKYIISGCSEEKGIVGWDAVRVVKLDRLLPEKEVKLKVKLREAFKSHKNKGLTDRTYKISFKSEVSPAEMAFEDRLNQTQGDSNRRDDELVRGFGRPQSRTKGSCELLAVDKTSEELFQMLTVPAVKVACQCTNITLQSRDWLETFEPTLFFLWVLRNSGSPRSRVKLLDAMSGSNATIFENALKASPEGLVPREKERRSRLKRTWDWDFKIPWDDIFLFSKTKRQLTSTLDKVPEGTVIAPRTVVIAINALGNSENREDLVEAIGKHIRLPNPPTSTEDAIGPQRDWTAEDTSPIAAAIRQHEPEVLKALLEKYGNAYTRVVSATLEDAEGSPPVLGWPELVIQAQCYECVSPVKSAIAKLKKTCEGKNDPSSGISEEACVDFEKYHRHLDIGNRLVQLAHGTFDAINFTAEFDKEVHYRSLRFASSELPALGLLVFGRLWKALPSLEELDLADNRINLCRQPREVQCTWYEDKDAPILPIFDEQDTHYTDPKEAQEACLAQDQVCLGLVSCDTTSTCRLPIGWKLTDEPQNNFTIFVGFSCFQGNTFDFLRGFVNLTSLNLANNPLCDRGIDQVSQGLSNATKLKTVFLNNIGITWNTTGLDDFAASLGELETLNISDNDLGAAGLAAVLPGKSLRVLNARNIGLTFDDEAAREDPLAYLGEYSEMREVDFSSNEITDRGVKKLRKVLTMWTKLEHLNLNGASLTGQSFPLLGSCLSNSRLKALGLGHNNFRNLNFSLFNALVDLQDLTALDVSNSDVSGSFLQLTMSFWPKLGVLSLCCNSLSLDSFRKMERELAYKEAFEKKAELAGKGASYVGLTALYLGGMFVGALEKDRVAEVKFELPKLLANFSERVKELGMSGYELEVADVANALRERHSARRTLPIQKLWLENRGLVQTKSYTPHQSPFWFLGILPNLTFLSVANSGLSSNALQGLLFHASQHPNLVELRISGSKFSLEDWPKMDQWSFPKLSRLEGNFTKLDMQYLRHYLPQARIKSALPQRRQHPAYDEYDEL